MINGLGLCFTMTFSVFTGETFGFLVGLGILMCRGDLLLDLGLNLPRFLGGLFFLLALLPLLLDRLRDKLVEFLLICLDLEADRLLTRLSREDLRLLERDLDLRLKRLPSLLPGLPLYFSALPDRLLNLPPLRFLLLGLSTLRSVLLTLLPNLSTLRSLLTLLR